MKKLYHRKGKVHPSPDADSAFRFLPVAIATLSAALVPEDQEVLAYLIAWSLEEVALPLQEQQTKRKATSQVRTHRPAFECSCFDCYTSFWSRWDASPNRELIHEAIDLFEDHMAARGGPGYDIAGKASVRGKNRKATRDDSRKLLMSWLEQNRKPEDGRRRFSVGNERDAGEGLAVGVQDAEGLGFGNGTVKEVAKAKQHVVTVDFEDKVRQTSDKTVSQGRASAVPVPGRGLMRRMFPDIMGFVAEHLWTVWSPPV